MDLIPLTMTGTIELISESDALSYASSFADVKKYARDGLITVGIATTHVHLRLNM